MLRYRRYFVNRTFPFVWTGFTLLTGGAMLGAVGACIACSQLSLLDLRTTVFRAVLTDRDLSGGELCAGPHPARADGRRLTAR